MSARVRIFIALCVVLLGATGGYVVVRGRHTQAAAPGPFDTSALDAALSVPHVLFVDTPDYGHRRLAVAPLADLSARQVTDLTCGRVYGTPAGGLCLGVDGTVAYAYNARTFNSRLQPGSTFDVQGVPSRVRVADNNQYASATVFVAGDSYGAPFSTRTLLFDLSAHESLGNLEDFEVLRDGARIQSPDFNFWGTTFSSQTGHFYATLGTGGVDGVTYLVEGDLATRQMRVLRENVECPSLSPDGTRLAFKKRIKSPQVEWQLSILDLATLQDVPLNETRSMDDQVEWLDNAHVLYAVPVVRQAGSLNVDIWETTVDGSQPPRMFMPDALSPAVVR